MSAEKITMGTRGWLRLMHPCGECSRPPAPIRRQNLPCVCLCVCTQCVHVRMRTCMCVRLSLADGSTENAMALYCFDSSSLVPSPIPSPSAPDSYSSTPFLTPRNICVVHNFVHTVHLYAVHPLEVFRNVSSRR